MCAPRVTRVVGEARSTIATRRAKLARLFLRASPTTLGSPAMSATGTLGTLVLRQSQASEDLG